jgi:hypothetical protein
VGLHAPFVPPGVEGSLVPVDPLRRGLMRGVARPGAQVEEEGAVGVDGPEVAHELDGPVGQIGTEVIALLDPAGRADGVVVIEERRHELVRLPAVEAVPAVEPAGQWPGRPRRRHVGLVLGAQMPLADGVGGVAGLAEYLGEESVLAGRLAPVARVTDGQVRHPAHPAAVMVTPGQQAGPGRGAECGGVEVGQAHPAGGQVVDHRRVDGGAVATELAEPHVVENDQHHIGRPGGRGGLGGPPRLGVAPVEPDPTAEFPLLTHGVLLASGSPS